MGELLRAILTQESKFSRPRYYYVESPTVTSISGQQLRLTISIEGGTTFLQTQQLVSIAFSQIGDGLAGNPVIPSNNYTYNWTAPRSYKDFMQNVNLPTMLPPNNYNHELYEYPLWRENETILITVNVLVGFTDAIYAFMLGGIEYLH